MSTIFCGGSASPSLPSRTLVTPRTPRRRGGGRPPPLPGEVNPRAALIFAGARVRSAALLWPPARLEPAPRTARTAVVSAGHRLHLVLAELLRCERLEPLSQQ